MIGVAGKGLVVRNWRSYASDPIAFADWYAARFDWAVIVIAGSRTLEQLQNDEPELYQALARRGVAVWLLWTLPQPTSWRQVLPAVFERAYRYGAKAVVINPEVEWKDRADEARLFALSARAASRVAGCKLVVATYPAPTGHPTFPWPQFAVAADVGMPLVFDRESSLDPAYFERAIREWRAVGFEALVPMGSLVRRFVDPDAPDTFATKTPAELAAYLGLMPPAPAIAFWTGGKPSDEIVQVLRTWPMRTTTPAVARWLLGPLADLIFGG